MDSGIENNIKFDSDFSKKTDEEEKIFLKSTYERNIYKSSFTIVSAFLIVFYKSVYTLFYFV